MAKFAPKMMLSAGFLLALPIIGGQVQGYPDTGVGHVKMTSGASTHFKSSSWPQIQQATFIKAADPTKI